MQNAMRPSEPRLPSAKVPLQRKFSQRQKKAQGGTSPLPGQPFAQKEGEAKPDSPGFQVKAPSASRSKQPSLHPGLRMSNAAKIPHRQPATSDKPGKPLEAAAAEQDAALGLPGGTRNPSRRSTKSKGTVTPWMHPVPTVPAQATSPAQGTRGEAAVHRPKASVTANRNSKCPPKIADAADPITHIKSPSRHEKVENRSRHQSHAAEKRVLAIPPCQAPGVRRSVQPLAPQRFGPSTKKSSVKHPEMRTRPSRRSTFAAKKADIVAPVEDFQGARLPKKSIMSPLRASRAGAIKPSLSSPKYAKGEAGRTVNFPAKPVALVRMKSHSDHFLSALDRPSPRPRSGRPSQQAANAADDILADLRGLTNAPDVPRFDPFRPPSNLEGSVGASGIGFPTTAVPPPKRANQKRLSSFPGMIRYSETAENAPKRLVIYSDREQTLALQRIAAMCVFLVAIAIALFFGYYMLLTNQDSRPSAPPQTSRHDGDRNYSIEILTLNFHTEDGVPTTAHI